MDNKGFTLIELVGAVVILAIIALFAFPALTSMLSNGQNKVDESIKSVLESAAAEYVNDNLDSYNDPVSICTLVNEGYISTSFYTKNEAKINGSSIKVTDNKYEYQEGGGEEDCLSNE